MDGTSENPFVLDDETAERMTLLQQLYQQQTAKLTGEMLQAAGGPALTLAQLTQYCAALQQQAERMDTATGSMSSLTGAGGASGSSIGSMPATPTTSHAPAALVATPPTGRQRKLTNDMRSLSGSSQTISQQTKDRLRTMIKRRAGSSTDSSSDLGSAGGAGGGGPGPMPSSNRGSTSRTPPSHASPHVTAPSPHYEPYPTQSSQRRDAEAASHEFRLRKVNSEPNIKAMIRSKLLSKGSSPVQGANGVGGGGAFGFPSSLQRQDSESVLAGAPSIIFPAGGMLPSPSLPNLLPPALQNVNPDQLNALLSQPNGLNSYLSLPTLLRNQLGLGMMEEQIVDRDKLDPRSAGASTSGGSLPIGGYPSLLKQQLRELVLRRKSLVREEPEIDAEQQSTSSGGGGEAAAHSSLLPPSFLAGLGLQPSTSGSSLHASSSSLGGSGRTGIVYDSAMAKHECQCGDATFHVEHGGRVQSIWARLTEKGLVARCEKLPSKKANLETLKIVHPQTYVTFFAVSPTACIKVDTSLLPVKSFVQLSCGGIGVDSDTYFNDATTQTAARLAVGGLVDLCCAVQEGKVRNGFACIRPPGHHAEREQAMGFCFFNNAAIAAKVLQQRYPNEVKKVAIVDWDVHHGNGTQPIFFDDPSVLYLSMHRHDNGNFFPGTGAVTEVGKGAGKGYTMNIAFSGGIMRDAEYLAAWRVLVQPVLEAYAPDFIIVSSGFDACAGHANALGGYEISASMFGYMTKQIMKYANGKVVLTLEGGYNLETIADAAEECLRCLTGEDAGELSADALDSVPCAAAQETIQKVIAIHKTYWPALAAGLQPINISESQWQHFARQFKAMTVGAAAAAAAIAS